MGKGDRKTAKGKRYNSSYGNSRSRAVTKAAGAVSAPVAKKAATKTATGDVRTGWYVVGALGAAAIGWWFPATPVLFGLAVLILLPRMLRI